METTDAFLALSPNFGSLFFTSPPPPISSTSDFAFAQLLESPNTPNLSLNLNFPQPSQEYPPLMSPELLQLFGQSELINTARPPIPQFMAPLSQDFAHPVALSFSPELLAQVANPAQQCPIITNPHLDIKCDPTEAPWISYPNLLQEVLSHPLPFQQLSMLTATPRDTTCAQPQQLSAPSYTQQEIKQEQPTPQSSALQKLHQRLLDRVRRSQHLDGSTPCADNVAKGEAEIDPSQLVVSDASKKADNSFNKVLEMFSYYFNTQKTASPLACTAALYLGQVGFELQKRYEAYSRYIKCGVLEEMLISITRATNLRKLGIKSYEEFLRAEVSELRRIKDPERYLNRRMQVFQSYEPEELDGVYLSFDALYLLAKKPPSFRKEWLEEGKIRIVHICEIHEAWRSSPLNKTKRARSPTELEETSDGCSGPKVKVLKAEH